MFRMTVQDVFFIKGRGLVATGRVELGQIRVGDEVQVNGARTLRVEGIEMFRKKVDEAVLGDNIGLLFPALDRSQLSPGDVLNAGGGHLASGGTEVKL